MVCFSVKRGWRLNKYVVRDQQLKQKEKERLQSLAEIDRKLEKFINNSSDLTDFKSFLKLDSKPFSESFVPANPNYSYETSSYELKVDRHLLMIDLQKNKKWVVEDFDYITTYATQIATDNDTHVLHDTLEEALDYLLVLFQPNNPNFPLLPWESEEWKN